MSDIEQARELLEAEYDKAGEKMFARRTRSGRYDNEPDMRAIAAALRAAPEGFALVPVPKPCECHPETCACDSQLRRSP